MTQATGLREVWRRYVGLPTVPFDTKADPGRIPNVVPETFPGHATRADASPAPSIWLLADSADRVDLAHAVWRAFTAVGEDGAAAPRRPIPQTIPPTIPPGTLLVHGEDALRRARQRAGMLGGPDTSASGMGALIPVAVNFDDGGALEALAVARPPSVIAPIEEMGWRAPAQLARRRGIPVLGLAARRDTPVQRRRLSAFAWRAALSGAHLYCRTDEDAERFRHLGAPAERLTIVGDPRVDAALTASAHVRPHAYPPAAPVLLCEGAAPGEEAIVFDVLSDLRRHFPTLPLVMRPARDDAARELLAAAAARGWRAETILPRALTLDDAVDVHVAVRPEALTPALARGGVALGGGSFLPYGGGDIVTPLMWGFPVVVGPYFRFWEQPAQAMETRGALSVTQTPAAVVRVARGVLEGRPGVAEAVAEARMVVRPLGGALRRLAEALWAALPPAPHREVSSTDG